MVIQVKLKKYRPVTINKQEHEESNIQHQKKGKSSKRLTLLEVSGFRTQLWNNSANKSRGRKQSQKTEKQAVSGTWEDLHKPAGTPDSWHKDNLTQRPQKEGS